MFAAGKSMGGRIASMVAARQGFAPEPEGLIFFGYPLHPPGKPEQRRDIHLPGITVPMLFAHGTKDPFGTPDEMAGLVAGLPGATVHLVDKGDHSLITKRAQPVSDDLLDRVADWVISRS
jgi:predicted alpha/beta-hydrolase family hydrolase